MSFLQRRLERNGFDSEHRGVAIINARAINVGGIIRNNNESTWWLHEPKANSHIHIAWGNNRTQKCQISRDYLPEGLSEIVWPLIHSDLWVAVAVAGETPGRASEPKPDDAVQEKVIHETDNVAIEDLPMDFTEEPNPHIHGTQPYTSLRDYRRRKKG